MVGTPKPPWLVSQRWEQLLFAHWQVGPDELRPLLPRAVEPDVRGDAAWVAIVAFVMAGTRMPAAPGWACLAPIPELNVRTYVRVGGTPGVWFLSLDASSPLFAAIGRSLYGLRYHVARMAIAVEDDAVHYLSSRTDAAFAATYRPCGPPEQARRGSLERFLVERYRLFSERNGRLVTATVTHEPWPLQPAEARIELNRMAPAGIVLRGAPLVHFARAVDARISTPVVLASASRRRVRAHRREPAGSLR
jgi:uncharacterized protein YqjF (DUF2071 family)